MNDIPYENESVLECDRTPHPVRENLTENIFVPKDSRIDVPTGDGLGINVDEDALRKFTQGSVLIIDSPSSGQRIF